jgi:hypothetical protein
VKSLRAVKGVDDREVMIGWKCLGEAPGRREEALGLVKGVVPLRLWWVKNAEVKHPATVKSPLGCGRCNYPEVVILVALAGWRAGS